MRDTSEAFVCGNALFFPHKNFSVVLLDNIAFEKHFIYAFNILMSFI